METIALKAPAKVNYRLDVLGKRPDGYHDLRMIMQRIDLCDEITVSLVDRPGITVICGSDCAPDGEENIAWRAARAILTQSGIESGIDIRITKQIPVAAGLGGGSSDAATVLLGLNELLGAGFTVDELMDIGVTLGADVPFFVFGKTALAEGIGEKLTAVEAVPELWLAVINPNVPVSTAWVYKNLELTNPKEQIKIPLFYGNVSEVAAILHNDLEAVTIGRFPLIARIKQQLLAQGAVGALMSGSGSTVFGIFEEKTQAEIACREVAAGTDWFARAVKTLS